METERPFGSRRLDLVPGVGLVYYNVTKDVAGADPAGARALLTAEGAYAVRHLTNALRCIGYHSATCGAVAASSFAVGRYAFHLF